MFYPLSWKTYIHVCTSRAHHIILSALRHEEREHYQHDANHEGDHEPRPRRLPSQVRRKAPPWSPRNAIATHEQQKKRYTFPERYHSNSRPLSQTKAASMCSELLQLLRITATKPLGKKLCLKKIAQGDASAQSVL